VIGQSQSCWRKGRLARVKITQAAKKA